jgi:hypothetical protein
MDEQLVDQILDELFSSFEASETRSSAILLFLKDQKMVTEEKLAPYLEEAGKSSNVRWRAARLRMGAMLAAAMKTPQPVAEKQIPAGQEKEPDINRSESRPPDRKAEGSNNKSESDRARQEKVEEHPPNNPHKQTAP